MRTLILPIGGKSSRFPGMRPKWCLTMPSGLLMLEEAIALLDFSQFERIIVIGLRSHFEKYIDPNIVKKFVDKMSGLPCDIVSIDHSHSQVETICAGLKALGGDFPFFVKDCDNRFRVAWQGTNEVAVVDLHTQSLVHAASKSFIEVGSANRITNIVEKKVISDLFCCGGYGFSSSKEFLNAASEIKLDREHYVSHVIFEMILKGSVFKPIVGLDYIDWGTLQEFRAYQSKATCLFIDFDGVLVYNSSKFDSPPWKYSPIESNLNAILELQLRENLKIIITTSRPKSEKDKILGFLQEHNINCDQVITDLPHCQRVLVNDFAGTNPYPSAIAINLPRNCDYLNEFI